MPVHLLDVPKTVLCKSVQSPRSTTLKLVTIRHFRVPQNKPKLTSMVRGTEYIWLGMGAFLENK